MKNLSLSLKNKKKMKIKSAVALKKNPGSSQSWNRLTPAHTMKPKFSAAALKVRGSRARQIRLAVSHVVGPDQLTAWADASKVAPRHSAVTRVVFLAQADIPL